MIVLTSFKEGELIKNALEVGAIEYLLKDVSADELARAIHVAYSGRATLSPEAAQTLVETANQPLVTGLDLAERKRENLFLMIEGLNNANPKTPDEQHRVFLLKKQLVDELIVEARIDGK